MERDYWRGSYASLPTRLLALFTALVLTQHKGQLTQSQFQKRENNSNFKVSFLDSHDLQPPILLSHSPTLSSEGDDVCCLSCTHIQLLPLHLLPLWVCSFSIKSKPSPVFWILSPLSSSDTSFTFPLTWSP